MNPEKLKELISSIKNLKTASELNNYGKPEEASPAGYPEQPIDSCVSKKEIRADGSMQTTGISGSESTVYTDEPIVFTSSQKETYTPPKYLEMRRIETNTDSIFRSANELFFRQAKFMESFEDNYEYRGEFFKYFPTYRDMNIFQLRGYFTWRTAVRKGIIKKTSMSFAFVYLYELINGIGISSAEDGYRKIKSFSDEYGKLEPKIIYYSNAWLRDYVIYHGLDRSLLSDFPETKMDGSLAVLTKYEEHSREEIFDALVTLSSYNLKKSLFFKKNPEDVTEITYRVYNLASVYFSKHRKSGLNEKLFGQGFRSYYHMFNSACFFEQKRHDNCVYKISDICGYRCENGHWMNERLFFYADKSKELGAILKGIDFFLRGKSGYKSTLKQPPLKKYFLKLINETIDEYAEEKRKKSLPKIEIDTSKLQSIRETSEVTQAKLIVDDNSDKTDTQIEQNIFNKHEDKNENTNANLTKNETQTEQNNFDKSEDKNENTITKPTEKSARLDKVKTEFLRSIFDGKDINNFCRKNGIMLSVFVDEINEELFDDFGDTVIEFNGDDPYIIEDYADELKGLIF